MLRLKSPPIHKFSIFVELAENIDPEWLLGRFDNKGELIESEIECEIDDRQALIKLYDYFREPFEKLPVLNFILRLGYGFDGKKCQETLLKKHKGKIKPDTEIAIIQYELIDFI